MDSVADRASYLLDAVISGHYRQVKFYLDAGYDQDFVDIHREGKEKCLKFNTENITAILRLLTNSKVKLLFYCMEL